MTELRSLILVDHSSGWGISNLFKKNLGGMGTVIASDE